MRFYWNGFQVICLLYFSGKRFEFWLFVARLSDIVVDTVRWNDSLVIWLTMEWKSLRKSFLLIQTLAVPSQMRMKFYFWIKIEMFLGDVKAVIFVYSERNIFFVEARVCTKYILLILSLYCFLDSSLRNEHWGSKRRVDLVFCSRFYQLFFSNVIR